MGKGESLVQLAQEPALLEGAVALGCPHQASEEQRLGLGQAPCPAPAPCPVAAARARAPACSRPRARTCLRSLPRRPGLAGRSPTPTPGVRAPVDRLDGAAPRTEGPTGAA